MRLTAAVICSTLLALAAFHVTLAPSAFCAGPEWVQLDQNEDSTFYYDKSGTSKPEKEFIGVKTRVIYTKEGKADALKILGAARELNNLYESRYRHNVDCAEHESRLLEVTHLNKEGVALKSTDLSASTEWEWIMPETRMALVLNQVCPK
jgi:hypothetical protein